MDGEAILKAYPQVVAIYEKKGCFDGSGNKVTIEDSKVTEARTTLDAEYAAAKYQRDRAIEYPSYGEQFDYIFHHGLAKWKTDIVQPVKDKFPKGGS